MGKLKDKFGCHVFRVKEQSQSSSKLLPLVIFYEYLSYFIPTSYTVSIVLYTVIIN